MGQPTGTPEAEARRAEVRASVATLKDRDDTVVSPYVFDGKSFAEIAAEQPGGMTRVMVQRQYRAAVGRLAKQFGESGRLRGPGAAAVGGGRPPHRYHHGAVERLGKRLVADSRTPAFCISGRERHRVS